MSRFRWRRSATSRRSSPNAGGIPPTSRLPLKSSETRWPSRPSSGGIVPFRPHPGSSSFVTRSSGPPTVTPCHSAKGRRALQLSLASPAKVSLTSSKSAQSARRPGLPEGTAEHDDVWPPSRPGPGGTGPVRRLSSSHTSRRFDSPASSVGTGPVRWLAPSASTCKSARFPSWEGMGPVNRLPSSTRVRRRARLPSATGMRPSSPMRGNSSAMTRPSGPPRVTPRHSLIGTASRQFSRAPPSSVSCAASSVVQSPNSPGLVRGGGRQNAC